MDKVYDAIRDNNWPVAVVQVKEKFGALVMYISYSYVDQPKNGNAIEAAHKYIEEDIYTESIKICEVCGKPGKRRTRRSWLKTLCTEHWKEWESGTYL